MSSYWRCSSVMLISDEVPHRRFGCLCVCARVSVYLGHVLAAARVQPVGHAQVIFPGPETLPFPLY